MLVSVIVPVYNVEQYLDECIASIRAQRMADFELLLVDDGSTDGSGAICDRHAEEDPRIRVFHTPNRGVSTARNLGLDNARGEFVVFVDADDRVAPNHLEQLVGSRIAEDGIAFTNMFQERPAGRRRPAGCVRVPAMPDCRVAGGREACMPPLAELLRRNSFGWTGNKMFSRATIERHGLRFDPDVRYAEDELFTARYCAHITHLASDSNPTYHYRYVPTSLLRGMKDPTMMLRIRDRIYEQYRSLGYSDEILYLSSRILFSRLRHELRRNRGWNTELADTLAQGILDNWKRYRNHVRAEFLKEFYDMKALWIARLICMPGSKTWVKLAVKGLRL